jgi:hypothetical protein
VIASIWPLFSHDGLVMGLFGTKDPSILPSQAEENACAVKDLRMTNFFRGELLKPGDR